MRKRIDTMTLAEANAGLMALDDAYRNRRSSNAYARAAYVRNRQKYNARIIHLELNPTARPARVALAADEGVDVDGKWVAICDKHSTMVGTRTKRDAQSSATINFCDACRAEPRIGLCPRCGARMEIGDEDPSERCCDACGSPSVHR